MYIYNGLGEFSSNYKFPVYLELVNIITVLTNFDSSEEFLKSNLYLAMNSSNSSHTDLLVTMLMAKNEEKEIDLEILLKLFQDNLNNDLIKHYTKKEIVPMFIYHVDYPRTILYLNEIDIIFFGKGRINIDNLLYNFLTKDKKYDKFKDALIEHMVAIAKNMKCGVTINYSNVVETDIETLIRLNRIVVINEKNKLERFEQC